MYLRSCSNRPWDRPSECFQLVDGECFQTVDGAAYRGAINRGKNGTLCADWSTAPLDVSLYPDAGLEGNACRLPYTADGPLNPFNSSDDYDNYDMFNEGPAPYCYTVNGEYETCAGCLDSYQFSDDGLCDDDFWTNDYLLTTYGTDCTDCGVRVTQSGGYAQVGPPSASCDEYDSCALSPPGSPASSPPPPPSSPPPPASRLLAP